MGAFALEAPAQCVLESGVRVVQVEDGSQYEEPTSAASLASVLVGELRVFQSIEAGFGWQDPGYFEVVTTHSTVLGFASPLREGGRDGRIDCLGD